MADQKAPIRQCPTEGHRLCNLRTDYELSHIISQLSLPPNTSARTLRFRIRTFLYRVETWTCGLRRSELESEIEDSTHHYCDAEMTEERFERHMRMKGKISEGDRVSLMILPIEERPVPIWRTQAHWAHHDSGYWVFELPKHSTDHSMGIAAFFDREAKLAAAPPK